MSCQRHHSEQAIDDCGSCGWGYCNRCLVYSFGPAKPPLCVGCALAAAGVRPARTAVASIKPDRRVLRAQRKAERVAAKAAAKAEKVAAKAAARQGLEPEPVEVPEPAMASPFATAVPLATSNRLDTVPSRVMRDRSGHQRAVPRPGWDLAQPG